MGKAVPPPGRSSSGRGLNPEFSMRRLLHTQNPHSRIPGMQFPGEPGAPVLGRKSLEKGKTSPAEIRDLRQSLALDPCPAPALFPINSRESHKAPERCQRGWIFIGKGVGWTPPPDIPGLRREGDGDGLWGGTHRSPGGDPHPRGTGGIPGMMTGSGNVHPPGGNLPAALTSSRNC